MERNLILQMLRQFILEQSNLDDPHMLHGDTDLFEAGLLDSLMAVSLISFCDEKLGCKFDDVSELSQENFSSINALTDFVSRKVNTHQNPFSNKM
jgi:acyl carrier protein